MYICTYISYVATMAGVESKTVNDESLISNIQEYRSVVMTATNIALKL